jgi:hypothetical protein
VSNEPIIPVAPLTSRREDIVVPPREIGARPRHGSRIPAFMMISPMRYLNLAYPTKPADYAD